MAADASARPALAAAERDAIAALRAAVAAAGYTVDRIESELGATELSGRTADRCVQRRRLRGSDAFAVLARLFLVEDPVSVADLESALAPVTADQLVRLGLCSVTGGQVRASAKLLPHGDYYIVSDAGQPAGSGIPFDYVPGVQAPSVTLAKLAVRRDVEAALDLGTGSGLQALLAAKHCRRVVATDVNPRALTFAAFNAELNGLGNVEFRPGWGFEPVADERFDLVVSNPPYVISPDHTYSYRDSEVGGAELCRRIVEAAPSHLTEGGFAHVLVSWTHDGVWDVPLRGWVAGLGCDAWLLHYRTNDPLSHAAGWLRPLAEDDPAAFEVAIDRWLGYCAERSIEAIGFGAVVLRRRSAAHNWTRAEALPLDTLEPASAHIQRVFAGNDCLDALPGDRGLLDVRLKLTDHHRIRQSLTCDEGRFQVTATAVELTDGLGFSVGLDRYTTLLVAHLDGSRPLLRAAEDTAAGVELTEAAREQFVPASLPAVRRLLELGFLEVVPG